MKKIFLIFICLTVILFTQTISKAQIDGWTRLQSDNGEFSIELPANYSYFFDADGFIFDDPSGKTYQFAQMQLLNAAAEKTVLTVEIYQAPSPKSYLNQLLEKQRMEGSKKDESQAGFTVKTFEQHSTKDYKSGEKLEISFITKFIASKTHLYVVTAANRGAETPTFQRFLSSMRLNSAPPTQIDNSQGVKISSLKPITIAQVAEDAGGLPKPDKSSADGNSSPDLKNVVILSKPRPTYTNAARKNMVTGTIRLRVTFAKDGQIPKIGIASGLPGGLNRIAFFAALRIKFIPQEKNGEFETVTKQIEYSFDIF